MKKPTDQQVKTALRVLAYYGTILNMRADVFAADQFAQVIDHVKHESGVKDSGGVK